MSVGLHKGIGVCTTALARAFLKTHKRAPLFLSVGPVGTKHRLVEETPEVNDGDRETRATDEFSDGAETETARQMFGKSKTKGERGRV